MNNKPSCCSDCWGWPADKTPEEGYCVHQFCKCHKTSSLQDLMREREAAFGQQIAWMLPTDMVLTRKSVEDFLRESIRLAFLAGMEEAKGCVPGAGEGTGSWNRLREHTLAAIEKKSREVEEGLI